MRRRSICRRRRRQRRQRRQRRSRRRSSRASFQCRLQLRDTLLVVAVLWALLVEEKPAQAVVLLRVLAFPTAWLLQGCLPGAVKATNEWRNSLFAALCFVLPHWCMH